MGPSAAKHPPGPDQPRTGTLRLNEGAALLGVSTGTLRRWANDGKVRCVRTPGGQRRFRLEDLAAAGLLDAPPRGAAAAASEAAGNRARRSKTHLVSEFVALSSLVTRVRDVDELMQLVGETLVSALDVADCDIYRRHADGSMRCLVSMEPGGRDHAADGKVFDLKGYGPAAEALATGRIVVAPDPGDERLTARDLEVYAEFGFCCEVAVPLLAGDQTVGLLELYDVRPRDFEESLDFLVGISRLLGGALENTLLMQQLDRTNRELSMLVDSGLQMSASLDLDEVLRTVAVRMSLVAGTRYCDVFSLEDGVFHCLVSHGPDDCTADYQGSRLSLEESGIRRLAVERREPVAVYDADEDERLNEADREGFRFWGLRSTLCVPLLVAGEIVGTADVYDTRPRVFENVDLLRALATTAASAIRNAQAFRVQEQQQARLASLLDASRAISSSLVVEDVLDAIVKKAAGALGANDCIIFAYDRESDTITPRALYQTDPVGYECMGETSPLAEYGMGCQILAGDRPVFEYISDPDLDPVSRESMERWGEKSSLTMPLKFGDEPMGMLVITETGFERRYTPEELDLVAALGEQAAVALHNAGVFRMAEEQNARLASLIEASRAMTSTLDPEELLDTLVRGLAHVLGSPETLIYEYDAETDTIQAAAIHQDEPDGFADLHDPLPLVDYPSDRELLEGGEPLVESVSDADLAPDVRDSMERWGEKTSLSVPLRFRGEPLGIMCVLETTAERVFTSEEIELARSFGEQAAVAMHNSRMYENLRKQNEELALRERRQALVNESSMELSSSLETDAVLLAAARRLTAIVGVSACQIFKLVNDEEIVCVTAIVGHQRDPRWQGRRFALQDWVSTGTALQQVRPLAIRSTDDPRLGAEESALMREHGEKSVLILPLVAKGRVIGSIELVEAEREREFTQEEIATAEALCRVTALAIDNADLYTSQERQNRQLSSLLDAGRAITSTLVLDEVLELIARQAIRAFQLPWCRIYEYDADRDCEITRVTCRMGPDGEIEVDGEGVGEELFLSDYPAERGILGGHEVVVETLSDPTLDAVTRASMERRDEKTVLSVPLWFGEESLGVLALAESAAERNFSPGELELSHALGDQAAAAIHNAKLFQRLALRSDEMALLNKMARRVSSSLNVGEIVAAVVEELRPLAPIDAAVLVLLDEAGALEVAYANPPRRGPDGLPLVDFDPELVRQAVSEKVVFLDPPVDYLSPTGHPDVEGLRSALIIGLSREGGPSGGLILASRTPNAFSPLGRGVLDGVGAHLSLAMANARLYENMRNMHLGNLRALSSALSAKDYYTLGHTARVAAYAMLLGKELGWSLERLHQLEEVAYLHDIGKIAVSDRVLLKPGPLTDQEWRLMREHPVVGSEIIQGVLPDEFVAAVRHHHERFDGGGYPDGLNGTGIPEVARLLCVVDSYDAMSSRRPYRDALTFPQCLAEIERCSGSQFDPGMAAAFLRVLARLADLKCEATKIATWAAAHIDAAEHAVIREPGDEVLPEFARALEVLQAARARSPMISSIETERLVDGQRAVIVVDGDADPIKRIPIGELLLADEEQAEAFRGNRMDATVIYVDAWGSWVSGLAPILRNDGSVAALVSADVGLSGSGDGSTLRSDVTESFTALTHSAATRLTRMEIDAVMDSLTGLHNHRYLHERVSEELRLAAIQGSELSLLFVDVDRFKSVNDRFGHSAGDEILRTVAQLVVGCVRRIDVAARYGGDEFAVLLIGAGGVEAGRVAERVRAAVESTHVVGPVGRVTVSVGVATFPGHAATKAELLEKADWAMYLAKRAGRNRCAVFGEDECHAVSTASDPELRGYLAAMAQLAERRAQYPPEHTHAVVQLAEAVALDLKLGRAEAAAIGEAACLRDIGQLPVPDEVLLKAEPLTAGEWEYVRAHPRTGCRMLKELTGSTALAEAVLHHHERYDGDGYPDELSADQIPLSARIVAAVSTYQALLIDRPYRRRLTVDEARAELRRCAGTQLDPTVVEALLHVVLGGTVEPSGGGGMAAAASDVRPGVSASAGETRPETPAL